MVKFAVLGPDVRMDLRLEETRTFGNGVVLLNYSRDGAQGVFRPTSWNAASTWPA